MEHEKVEHEKVSFKTPNGEAVILEEKTQAKRLGAVIKAVRLQKGMTRQELADKINYTYDGVKNFESGTRNIRFHILQRIAKALEVDINALLTGQIPVQSIGPVLTEPEVPTSASTPDRTRQYRRAEDWVVVQAQPTTHKVDAEEHDALLIIYRMGQVERVCLVCKQRELLLA